MDNQWYAVLRASKLKRKPVRVLLHGEALVVFRTSKGLACLRDMCPHRAASLSGGEVVEDTLQCPYHGWRFNGEGNCTHIPLLEGELPKRLVRRWDACESDGLIFVCRDAKTAKPIARPLWDHQPKVSKILESQAVTTMVDAVENVLDPIHTLFVHKGLIRGEGKQASEVALSAEISDGCLIMRFDGEEEQDGLLSRLLEGKRSHAISRFENPGVVSLEYWGFGKLNLVTTFYFTPETATTIKGFAIMTGPRQYGFGYLKAMLFLLIMRKVINQDLAIMEDAMTNWLAAGQPPHAASPLDILRPLIETVLVGASRDVAPKTLVLKL